MTDNANFDVVKKVIVVGAGPAGMMAAIKAATVNNEVTLLEKMNSLRKKIAYNRQRQVQHNIFTSNRGIYIIYSRKWKIPI